MAQALCVWWWAKILNYFHAPRRFLHAMPYVVTQTLPVLVRKGDRGWPVHTWFRRYQSRGLPSKWNESYFSVFSRPAFEEAIWLPRFRNDNILSRSKWGNTSCIVTRRGWICGPPVCGPPVLILFVFRTQTTHSFTTYSFPLFESVGFLVKEDFGGSLFVEPEAKDTESIIFAGCM